MKAVRWLALILLLPSCGLASPAAVEDSAPTPSAAELPSLPPATEWDTYIVADLSLAFTYPTRWFVHEAGKALQITPNAQPTWSSYFNPNEPHGGPTFDLMHNLNRQMGATPLTEVEILLQSYEAEIEAIAPAASLAGRSDVVMGAYRFMEADDAMVLLVGAAVNPIQDSPQPVIAMTGVVKSDDLTEMQAIFEAILRSLHTVSAPTSAAPEPTIIAETPIIPTPSPTPPPTPTLVQRDDLTAVSPNGQWQVVVFASEQVPPNAEETESFPDGKYFVEMIIERVDGRQLWTAVAEWRSWGLGLTYPELVRWSGDGRFFYFANVPVPDGCSPFVNGGDLWRLDLESGETTEIAPYIGLVMALSPDETQLAVNASYGRGFLIRDLASGDEQPIPLPQPADSWKMGGLQWSPDGQHLLLVQATNPCSPEMETAVVRVTISDQTATTLLEPDARNFTMVKWLQSDKAQLMDELGDIWYLDIFSGELSDPEAGD